MEPGIHNMHIEDPASVPKSADDILTKTKEAGVKETAGIFFAQINQIMHFSLASDQNLCSEKPAEKIADASLSHSMTHVGHALLPEVPAKANENDAAANVPLHPEKKFPAAIQNPMSLPWTAIDPWIKIIAQSSRSQPAVTAISEPTYSVNSKATEAPGKLFSFPYELLSQTKLFENAQFEIFSNPDVRDVGHKPSKPGENIEMNVDLQEQEASVLNDVNVEPQNRQAAVALSEGPSNIGANQQDLKSRVEILPSAFPENYLSEGKARADLEHNRNAEVHAEKNSSPRSPQYNHVRPLWISAAPMPVIPEPDREPFFSGERGAVAEDFSLMRQTLQAAFSARYRAYIRDAAGLEHTGNVEIPANQKDTRPSPKSDPIGPLPYTRGPQTMASEPALDLYSHIKAASATEEVSAEGEVLQPALLLKCKTEIQVLSGREQAENAATHAEREFVRVAPQNNSAILLPDTGRAQILASKPKPELYPQIKSDFEAEENCNSRSNLPTSQAFNPEREPSKVPAFYKWANPGQAISENRGVLSSQPGPSSIRGEFISSETIRSGSPENQPEGSRFRIPVAENQQDRSLQAPAGPSRSIDWSNLLSSIPDQVSNAQSKELIIQVAERIQILLRQGKGEIRLQLKPDNLGRLEIRAVTTSNAIVARIATESNYVKSYLESNLQLLQQTLQDQGLRIERIHITLQNGADGHSSSGYAAQFGHSSTDHHSGRESTKPSGASRSAADNLLEEITVDPMALIHLNPHIRFHRIA